MKPFVLVGAGQYADYVQHILEKSLGYQVVAFSVTREFISGSDMKKNGLPVVCFEELPTKFPVAEYNVAIAMLGSDMYQTRQKLFEQCLEWGYQLPNIIHPSVIDQSESIGIGNIVGAGTIFGAFSEIGNGNVFFENSLLSHNVIVRNFNLLASFIVPAGNSTIGNHCFVGAGSVINNRVKLADFTLVGATAFVAKDTKPYDVVVAPRSITLEGKSSLNFGQ